MVVLLTYWQCDQKCSFQTRRRGDFSTTQTYVASAIWRIDTELLQLSEDSVWHGGLQGRTPRNALSHLRRLRELIRDGKHASSRATRPPCILWEPQEHETLRASRELLPLIFLCSRRRTSHRLQSSFELEHSGTTSQLPPRLCPSTERRHCELPRQRSGESDNVF